MELWDGVFSWDLAEGQREEHIVLSRNDNPSWGKSPRSCHGFTLVARRWKLGVQIRAVLSFDSQTTKNRDLVSKDLGLQWLQRR
jgi:hypothetical protein